MQPASRSGPRHHSLISPVSANGETEPVWPPAPAETAMISVDAHLGAFARVAVARDIVEHEPAIGMDRRDDLGVGPERQHDDRRLVLDDQVEIGAEPRVGAMADEIDRIRRRTIRQRLLDPGQIRVEILRWCGRSAQASRR